MCQLGAACVPGCCLQPPITFPTIIAFALVSDLHHFDLTVTRLGGGGLRCPRFHSMLPLLQPPALPRQGRHLATRLRCRDGPGLRPRDCSAPMRCQRRKGDEHAAAASFWQGVVRTVGRSQRPFRHPPDLGSHASLSFGRPC